MDRTEKPSPASEQESCAPGSPIWEAAWAWVLREHENKGLDEASKKTLQEWLSADALHQKTYEKANRLWALTGLLPPRNNLDDLKE